VNIALVTIPGTGTRFFNNILSWHYPKTAFEDDGLTTGHVNGDLLERLAGIKPFVVTTWRPYGSISETLRRRDFNPMSHLPMHWKAWERLVEEFNPAIVTIEPTFRGQTREQRLADLGRRLGITLETDWTPVR
jgi:hypothetical protein